METIVENLKLSVQEKIQNDDYNKLLKDAGMKAVTTGCPIITIDAIEEYLLYIYSKKYSTYEKIETFGFMDRKKRIVKSQSSIQEISKNHIGIYCQFWAGERKLLYWLETPIENFVGLPPKHVLESIKKYKDQFDKIVVVTLKEKTVLDDPLICGRRKGDPNRYLIDWYDKDIDVSEINFK